MRLESVYARFFRSLNYDYMKKSHERYEPAPWDDGPGGAPPYPFVRIRLEPDITTIVGANESGKSQVLAALKRALTGIEVERRDFCRYSDFFSEGHPLLKPEFGLRLEELADRQRKVIQEMCGLDEIPAATTALVFRMNDTPKERLYLDDGDDWTCHHIKKPTLLPELGLPAWFEIDAKVPLPDSVPLEYLATGKIATARTHDRILRRVYGLIDGGLTWFADDGDLVDPDAILSSLRGGEDVDDTTLKKYALADDLLIKVVGQDRELFREIQRAATDDAAYATAMVESVNAAIAQRLNLRHWWSQDSDFKLTVELRRSELVFMIRDRTGTSYAFAERSEGLKYFLSYFVQYLAHEPVAGGRPELLLMDEPDAFLSARGQQDLLRIFDAFAHPDTDVPPVQVVYVTHSPFLIDKSHAERIRVLEKGEHDEGTRVVGNASKNHYEPLRSAFGSFVGETTFIGNCNLLVEGPSDQILLAGMTRWLAARGIPSIERLDLNTVTLVPAAGASQIPYMAYLARGRDVEKPAVIVLLDADTDGKDALEVLLRGGPREERLVDERFILLLDDAALGSLTTVNPAGVRTIEDLIPLPIAIAAVHHYYAAFGKDLNAFAPTSKVVFQDNRDTLKGLEAALVQHLSDERIHPDKIGFARSVIDFVEDASDDQASDLSTLEANFRVLLSQLARLQRDADRDASNDRIGKRVNRETKRFVSDHPRSATREEVLLLVELIERQLDHSREAEEVLAAMRRWNHDFALHEDPAAEVEDYGRFIEDLRPLAYAGDRAVQDPQS
jgi:energy-coupling factor transporter ATP-binding protein EcfA2